MSNRPACFVCGSETDLLRGIYQPPWDARKLLGEPLGKTRCFGYFVCHRCFACLPIAQIVEENVLWRLRMTGHVQ
jgi:hypothetical protein